MDLSLVASLVAIALSVVSVSAMVYLWREMRRRDDMTKHRASEIQVGVDARSAEILAQISEIAESNEGIVDMLDAWDAWWLENERRWAQRHAAAASSDDSEGATIAAEAQCAIVRTRQVIQSAEDTYGRECREH